MRSAAEVMLVLHRKLLHLVQKDPVLSGVDATPTLLTALRAQFHDHPLNLWFDSHTAG